MNTTNTTNTAAASGAKLLQTAADAIDGMLHICCNGIDISPINAAWEHGEKVLVELRAALAAPAQPAAPSDAAAGFFAFSDDCGFDRYDTAAEAKSAAQEMLDDLRMEAGFDEWPMNVTSVCWGAVMERATETNQEATDNGEEHCDYTLIGSAPPPVAARAAAQAAPVDAENEIDLLAEAALCERLDACLAAARAALAAPAQPAPSASVEQEAMQMLWDDQQQEEKEHYRNVARGTELPLYAIHHPEDIDKTKRRAAPEQPVAPANVDSVPLYLNLNDRAMWVLGWNACLDKAHAAQKAAAQAQDALRLSFLYSRDRTDSSTVLEMEITWLNGRYPTLEQVRDAIDAAIAAKKGGKP